MFGAKPNPLRIAFINLCPISIQLHFGSMRFSVRAGILTNERRGHVIAVPLFFALLLLLSCYSFVLTVRINFVFFAEKQGV